MSRTSTSEATTCSRVGRVIGMTGMVQRPRVVVLVERVVPVDASAPWVGACGYPIVRDRLLVREGESGAEGSAPMALEFDEVIGARGAKSRREGCGEFVHGAGVTLADRGCGHVELGSDLRRGGSRVG